MAQVPPFPPGYYALDVECVATGRDHNARAVAQIGLVVSGAWLLLAIVQMYLSVCVAMDTGGEAVLVERWPPTVRGESDGCRLPSQDMYGRSLLNLVVRPQAPVVSCLTPITGYAINML